MRLAPDELAQAVRAGRRRALAQAITLIESSRPAHRNAANALLEQLMAHTGAALRLGISGAPGVGKSTFIEALGMHVIEQGQRIAVLAVDPSSSVSGGSILGDKTRMERLAKHPRAFIRPSPTGNTLGGVARRSREALLVLAAAGFDVVAVETVGVGQSETAVAEMTDMFILLLSPGGGDELQGIKRGIMELADLVLVNKADGELTAAARRAAADYRNALRLLQPRSPNWQAPVKLCSALLDRGVEAVWQDVLRYHRTLSASGELQERRAVQARAWLWSETTASLIAMLKAHPRVKAELPGLEQEVIRGKLAPSLAAQRLLALFLQDERDNASMTSGGA